MLTNEQLAARAREAFNASGKTQQELASELGVTQPLISMALKGEVPSTAIAIIKHCSGVVFRPITHYVEKES